MLFFILILCILVILYVWYLYNNLVASKIRVKEAWSQIDVQLKRRADLIPNLVSTVKGYAKHEKNIFENVTIARSSLLAAEGPAKKALANNQLASALKSLFAVAENYPQLQASGNFLQLQKELGDTEDKVAYARQFYNTAVLEFNTKIQIFPNILMARNLGFTEVEFFQTQEEEKKKVEVEFN
ncbi:LemA family protein [Candidatus Gottesmanbacteria bacterium]|nr:LemA family protein [Candidatus Gottesmanbacteria bacterium]